MTWWVVGFENLGAQDRPIRCVSSRATKGIAGAVELAFAVSVLNSTTHHSPLTHSHPCSVSSANCVRYSLNLAVRSGSAKARMATARRAALAAPSTATVATGMPVGI